MHDFQSNINKNRLLSKRFQYAQGVSSPTRGIKFSALQEIARKGVEQKVIDDIYTFEENGCFCRHKEVMFIAARDRYNLYYPVVICKRCGLIRNDPRMTRSSYREFYDIEYRNLYGDGDLEIDVKWNIGVRKGEKIWQFVADSLPGFQGVVFDVGCYMGASLLAFSKRGFVVAGVDYGREHLEYGKKYSGVKNLYVGGIERLAELNKKADLIILSHVIEHLVDLESELKNIRNIMKPNAYIYIATPGLFWRTTKVHNRNFLALLNNAHTYYFSLDTLVYVMECLGFELVKGNNRIKALFKKKDSCRSKDNIPHGEYRRTKAFLKRTEAFYSLTCRVIRLLELFHVKGVVKWLLSKFVTMRRFYEKRYPIFQKGN